MKKLIKSFLIGAGFLFSSSLSHAANPIRYVQISTNAVTQQTGTYNVSGGTVTTLSVTSKRVFAGTGTDTSTTTYSGTQNLNALAGNPIHGTNTNDSASAGWIGEIISSVCSSANAVTPTSNQYIDVASINLTAGDWDVSGIVEILASGGNVTGTSFAGAIGTISGNSSTGVVYGDNAGQSPTMPTTAADVSISIPAWRVSINSTTTYYLKEFVIFTVNTPKGYGRISARRVR